MKKKMLSFILCVCMVLSLGMSSMAASGTFQIGGWDGSYSLTKNSDGGGVTAKTTFPQNNQWEAIRKTWAKMYYTKDGNTKTKSSNATVRTIPYQGGNLTARVVLYVTDQDWKVKSAESVHEVNTIKGNFYDDLSF